MKWFFLFSLLALFISQGIMAQAPQSFNYQAVARDQSGNVITGNVNVRFSLHEDNTGGSVRYKETNQTTTTTQGVFSMAIGSGTVVSGSMSDIDWANHQYFLEVELKADGNTNYTSMGTTQLLSVPYAMYAAKSGTTLDAGNGIEIQNNTITNTGDLSSDNELQTLDVNGNQLSISNGNTVTLPTGTTYMEGAGIDINGNTISANDISPTNEIQTLSINGNQLSLSNGGGSIQLPAGNSSWATNGTVTYNNPTTNDVGIGTDFNSNAKLNVISTGNKHAGNFTSPGSGDALHAYCNGTGAGISASSLSGSGGVFTATTGTAGYFSSTSGKGLIVDHGNVGIGTNSPIYKLDVAGTINVDGGQNPGTASALITSHNGNSALEVTAYNGGSAAHLYAVTGKALTVDNATVGGMGTGIRISTSQGHWDQYLDINEHLNFASDNVLRAWILPSDGSYHNSSDRRLKKDIQPFSNVLPGISKLQAYTYHMKDAPEDAPLSIGFMAQEVEQQFPQMVLENNGYKSLCYDQFAVLSIQAVKEQETKIDTLEQKVNDLEGQLLELKALLMKMIEKSK
ncbi:MAG: tail fiber domain-containing protein [Saprospiraceae bacterium]|uniref:Tail fiber domain-containing protein n=1 Tax=Candidatus Opimibacter skivensis TaxID=2982028 RepID=A0A9D7SXT1_9BACT|nr:tail fiber domain-containing protein [Candidatus Opimibacter skivensis]